MTSALLKDKVVLVTGAGRGMGRAHAVLAARAGADLVLLDLPATTGELEQTAAAVLAEGRRAVTVTADVRDSVAVQDALNGAVERLGRLDAVVANAGIAPEGANLWKIEPHDWQRVLDINLTGVFNTCRATIPHLMESENGPSLVLISSTAGQQPLPTLAHYNASKAGVRSISATLANELGPHGIRCNAVLPGSVRTPMTDDIARRAGISVDEVLQTFLPLQLLPSVVCAEDVSQAVVWLLSDQTSMITGQEICVDAGLTARAGPLADGPF